VICFEKQRGGGEWVGSHWFIVICKAQVAFPTCQPDMLAPDWWENKKN